MTEILGDNSYIGFVKLEHLQDFIQAAHDFNAYILVRKTGEASLKWVGRNGYTAKRADLKCKTARQDVDQYQLAGLVCSPFIHPFAFGADRRSDAIKLWVSNQNLITVPKENQGFDESNTRWCLTPYILQNNPNHKHYGCLAFVECGLLTPKYVHGDYDLYAIVPVDNPSVKATRRGNLSTSMAPSSLTLEQLLDLQKPVPNIYGPLWFRVMNWLDAAFGYPMIMHGEQENRGHIDDSVIVFLPAPKNGSRYRVLNGEVQIREFYINEFEGRVI